MDSSKDQDGRKPGGKTIRGGISKVVQRIMSPSRIREAFMRSMDVQMTKVTVSNLAPNVTDSELFGLFHGFGPVKYARVQYNEETGTSMGYAYVRFENRADAMQAVKMYNGILFNGRPMHLEPTPQNRQSMRTSSDSNINVRCASELTSSLEKNKRKSRQKNVGRWQSTDNETDAQLEECMKSKLNISDNAGAKNS